AAAANGDEEARRILRETLAKIDAPKPASEAVPVVKAPPAEATKPEAEVSAKAPSPQPSPAVGEREKSAPVAEKTADLPAKSVAPPAFTLAAVQDGAKADAAVAAQPPRTPLEKVSENKTL